MGTYTTKIIIPLLDYTVEVLATESCMIDSVINVFYMKSKVLEQNKKE